MVIGQLRTAAIWATVTVAAGGAFCFVAAARPQAQPITITLTGQAMIRSDLRATAPKEIAVIQSLVEGSGPRDVVFTNFEATVAEPGESTSEGRGFLTPPETFDALKLCGFNLIAFASNHSFDLKAKGIANTIREADARGIVHAGTGNTLAEAAAPAYLHTAKGTIALVASASGLIQPGGNATADHAGVNELRVDAGGKPNEASDDLPGAGANAPNADDAQRILGQIREARQHADLVIVYEHNHVFGNHSFSNIFSEGLAERLAPNEWLVKWTHAEIDAGADIVVMHGAPLLHGIEIYRGHPIFYDLGNFIYNVPPTLTYIGEPMNFESAVAYVEFQGRELRSVSLRPIALNNIGDGQPDAHSEYTNNEFLDTRGLPAPATGAKAGYILQRVADASKPFGTTIQIDGEMGRVELTGR
jgi:poly-gamma-glutamate capsule biosynthesis protein CapA/YwtB (metallophosphatase superfamily)